MKDGWMDDVLYLLKKMQYQSTHRPFAQSSTKNTSCYPTPCLAIKVFGDTRLSMRLFEEKVVQHLATNAPICY